MYPHLTGFWPSLPLRHSRPSIIPSHPVIASAAKQSGAVWPPCKRGSRGGVPLWRSPGGPSHHVSLRGTCKRGSPEGAHPSGRRYGGCASIKPRFFTSPFLLGRGLGGWSEPPSRPSYKSQESGTTPSHQSLRVQRSKGCSLSHTSRARPPRLQRGVQRGCTRPGGMEDVPP